MIFYHKEFDFLVRSPEDIALCTYYKCKEHGSFHVIIKDDKNVIVADYQNICDKHIIFAFLGHFGDKDY